MAGCWIRDGIFLNVKWFGESSRPLLYSEAKNVEPVGQFSKLLKFLKTTHILEYVVNAYSANINLEDKFSKFHIKYAYIW